MKLEEPRLWFRVVLGDGAVGPGKADLLEAIAETGSIAAAGRSMRMSYRRAWRIVEEMNRLFGASLVETERGGEAGGGSRLTPLGRQVADDYRALQRELDAAARPWLDRLVALRSTP